jgi:hypothetical protein
MQCFFQNVWAISNNFLLWIHGIVQSGIGNNVWYVEVLLFFFCLLLLTLVLLVMFND